jgi:hypothetical protein
LESEPRVKMRLRAHRAVLIADLVRFGESESTVREMDILTLMAFHQKTLERLMQPGHPRG